MKITIITGPFIPFPPVLSGAVEKVWYSLSKEFAVRGHEVHLIGRAADGAPSEEVRDGVRLVRRFSPIRTGRLPINLARDLWYSGRISRAVPPSDIVVTNSFFLPLAVPLLARRIGRLVVHLQRWPKRQIPLYLHADRIAVPSPQIAAAIIAQCERARGVTRVIPNPVDLDAFTPSNESAGGVLPPNRDHFIIVYAGRIHPEKGLETLAKAVHLLSASLSRPLRLRLVGPVAESAGGGGTAYLRKIESLAPPGAVETIPPVSDPVSLANELRHGDLFCYPSVAARGEASPVGPLEAMAAGVPPVVSGLPVFRQHITNGQNGVIFDHLAPDPAASLADALRSVLEDADLRRTLSVNARRHAENFGVPAVADLYLEDFRRLLDSPGTEPIPTEAASPTSER